MSPSQILRRAATYFAKDALPNSALDGEAVNDRVTMGFTVR